MNRLFTTLTILAVAVVPATAAAAIPPVCIPVEVAPRLATNGAAIQIPKNLPAFVAGMSNEAPSAKLHGPEGREVSVTVTSTPDPFQRNFSDYILHPSEELTAGTWDLEIADRCSDDNQLAATMRHRAFVVAAEAPMPTKTGTLVLHDTGITGGRGDDFSAVAGVTLTPSPELAAFLHTTRFVVTVDGVAQDASAGFGPTDYDVFPQLSSGPGLQAVTPCSKPGKHTIEVRAEVAGSTAPIAAATIEWDAVCPALPRSVSDVTEPAPPRAMGQAEPSSSSSGCSVGASNASGALPLLGALVGLVVAARRRKARR